MPFTVSKNLLPASASNRPGRKLPTAGQLFIVVHETGNSSPGADAKFHIDYLHLKEARDRKVSYHFSVDDRAVVQGLPLDEIGWHAGDNCDDPVKDIGCFRSIAIEGCINADGNETQMRRNFAELIRRICADDPAFDWGGGSTRGRFTPERIKQHIQVSDPGPGQHYCPENMLRDGYWPTFMQLIAPPSLKVKFDPPRTFHAVQGALLRQGPSRDFAVVRSLAAGAEITSKGYVLGQVVAGEDRWLQTTDSPIRYIHKSGVTEDI